MEKMRNECKILVGKPEGKGPHGKTKRRLNVKFEWDITILESFEIGTSGGLL
jgi:hypothetical protein